MVVSVRPENFRIVDHPTGLSGTVRLRQFLGAHVQYNLDMADGGRFQLVRNADFGTPLHEIGDVLHLEIDERAANVFDAETTETLIEGVHRNVVAEATKA